MSGLPPVVLVAVEGVIAVVVVLTSHANIRLYGWRIYIAILCYDLS